MSRSKLPDHFHAVILAGGRGTRFWPRSRKRAPKQLLPVVGGSTLLQQTVSRLRGLAPPERIWVCANDLLRRAVMQQLPDVPAEQIVAEPTPRNTAPCIGLAARMLLRGDPDAVMGVFPADHLIENERPYRAVLRQAVTAADSGKLLVLGIEPRWAETGYGYIQFPKGTVAGAETPVGVIRFHEKPGPEDAERFVRAGNFFWNSGQFVWRAQALWDALEQFLPETAKTIDRIAGASPQDFNESLAAHYAACENISVDYGILEKSGNIAGFATAGLGWNDVGSWQALYSLLPKDKDGNAARTAALFQKAAGNFIDAPGKCTALLGVNDLIVVDTPDALLICPRSEAQKVSALVEALEAAGRRELL